MDDLAVRTGQGTYGQTHTKKMDVTDGSLARLATQSNTGVDSHNILALTRPQSHRSSHHIGSVKAPLIFASSSQRAALPPSDCSAPIISDDRSTPYSKYTCTRSLAGPDPGKAVGSITIVGCIFTCRYFQINLIILTTLYYTV